MSSANFAEGPGVSTASGMLLAVGVAAVAWGRPFALHAGPKAGGSSRHSHDMSDEKRRE